MKESIAIIGVSFNLPNITNWGDLKSALSNKNTFIDKMPEHRLKEIQSAFGISEMSKAGYIQEIDKFDNEYFGFTERESVRTPPEHRLFLSYAMKAFYNAGYCEETLKESKTGIFFNVSNSSYHHYEQVSNLSLNDWDLVRGIEATHLANYLDIRGPVLSIDTSCSSSLVAINVAQHSLNSNQCEMALVGGVKTLAITKAAAVRRVVHSKKEECKPFDQNADGMMNGEGAIFFVLKRFEQAIKDGDPIMGEIKGIGINHGGGRISSLTAPSPEAQKDAIIQAWEESKVNLKQIRYIEAHGTGTLLGDPIEVEGLKQAFSEMNHSPKNAPIAFSSFKGQIGHLDYLSGFAGLLRLIAALNFKKIPLQPNFETLNRHINLNDTGLYIPTKEEDWHAEDGERIGGVSSFGMTGTNVHLVVSQKETLHILPTDKEVYYLQISHKDNKNFDSFKKYLAEKINKIDNHDEIARLCLKLNSVFQISKYSQGIVFDSKESLTNTLTMPCADSKVTEFLLLDLEILSYPKEFIEKIFIENVYMKEQWDKYISIELKDIRQEDVLNVLFQYTIYRYLFEKLGDNIKFITTQEESTLNLLLKSKIGVQDITNLNKYFLKKSLSHTFNENAFKKYLFENFTSKEVVIIDFSTRGNNRYNFKGLSLKVIDGALKQAVERYSLYMYIISKGANPLRPSQNPTLFHDIELPYFNPKRFWPELNKNINLSGTTGENEMPEKLNLSIDEIKRDVKSTWISILEIDDVNDNDDFFSLGGTSLQALDMFDNIEKNIKGAKIPYENIYSYSTVHKLSEMISYQLNNSKASDIVQVLDEHKVKKTLRNIWISILETSDFTDDDDFFDMGGTSLSALDMIDDIEKSFEGVKIPYEEIYACSTISKLADKVIPNAKSDQAPVIAAIQEMDSRLRENQYQELIDEIKKEKFSKIIPKNILITGGTGLLGMSIIDYLYNNTSANLYCLVRSKEHLSGEQRFITDFSSLYKYHLKDRISFIEGDLYMQGLGLKNLMKEPNPIDSVFHIAGSPNFSSRNTVDEHINYVGTKNIVDWSNQNGISKLVFISTIGVTGQHMPSQVINFYETDVNLGQSSKLIHGVTKLKAENYIHDNGKFHSNIFRISNIGGQYKDGGFFTDLNTNLMWQRLKSLINLGFYCEEVIDNYSGISFFPVDLLSTIISELSFLKNDSLNTFHLSLVEQFSIRELLSALKRLGFNMQQLEYEAYVKRIAKSNLAFHQVARKDTKFNFRDEATRTLLSKNNLIELLNFDRITYLEKLIQRNYN